MLGDASDQNGAYFQVFPNLPRIFLASLKTKHRAARHDLEVGQLRQCADKALGQAVAQIFIARICSRINEWQNGDRTHLAGPGFGAQIVNRRNSDHHDKDERNPSHQEFTPAVDGLGLSDRCGR